MANHTSNFRILAAVQVDASNIQQQLNDATKNLTVGGASKAGQQMKNAGLNFQQANQIYRETKQVISQMVEQVYNLDAALIEYQKVSDLSGSALDSYVEKLQKMGKEVARTGSEMISAAGEFRKSGFSDEESAQLARTAALLQNVSDEEMSAGDAASFLISQMVAFGIEAKDAEHIVDALNNTSNHFAVSSGDLAQGLGIVASTSAAMGNSFEETQGMMVAIVEQTRSASKASRALNTIMSRTAQALDETSTTGKKVNEVFEEQGIALKDSNGNMRSAYELLKDLADKWDSINPDRRKTIAQVFGGTNQLNAFLALMNNFNHAIEATETGINSAGSAAEENSAYIEGLESKVTGLKRAFEDFSNSVLKRGLVSKVLDLLTQGLELLNTDVGVFITQWGLLAGVLSGGIALLGNFAGAIIGGIEAIGKFITGAGILAGGFGSIAVPIAAVIALIVAATVATNKFKDEANDIPGKTQELTDMAEELKSNKEKLDELNKTPWVSRTSDIQAEIDKLEASNRALERNIQLKAEEIKKANVTLRTGTHYTSTQKTGEIFGIPTYGTYEFQSMESAISSINAVYGKGTSLADEYISKLKAVEHTEEVTIDKANEMFALAFWNRDTDKSASQFIDDNIDKLYQLADAYETLEKYGEEITLEQSAIVSLAKASRAGISDAFEMVEQDGQRLLKVNTDAIFTAENVSKYGLENLTTLAMNFADVLGKAEENHDAIIDIANASIEASEKFKDLGKSVESVGSKIDELPEKFHANQDAVDAFSGSIKGMGDAIDENGDIDTQGFVDLATEAGFSTDAIYYMLAAMGAVSGATIDTSSSQAAIDEVTSKAKISYEELMNLIGLSNTIIGVAGKYQPWKTTGKKKSGGGGGGRSSRDSAAQKEKEDMDKILSYYKQIADDELDKIGEAIDAINEKYDAEISKLEESNEELETQLELEQRLEDLETARSKKVLVFQNGRFQYAGDSDAVSAAQKNLNEFNRKQELENQKKYLNEKRRLELQDLEEEKKRWQEYKESLGDVTKAYELEQGKMLALQKDGTNLENQTWEERLKNLQNFKDRYNTIAGQIASTSGDSGGGGGGSWVDAGGGTGSSTTPQYNANSVVKTPRGMTPVMSVVRKYVTQARSGNKSAIQWLAQAGYTMSDLLSAGIQKYAIDNAGITKWFVPAAGSTYMSLNKIMAAYAKGTTDAKGGLALVGENGPEMRVLNSHDGILPAEITKNLWKWGAMTPDQFAGTTNNSSSINIENVTLPGVTNAEQFVAGLRNMALQRAYARG